MKQQMNIEKSKTVSRAPDYQKQAQGILIRKHEFYGSWADVGKEFGVNRGLLCAISKGKRKASDNVLRKLGIDVLVTVAIAVCPLHGLVHEKRCPGAEPKPRKPTKNWRGLALVLAGVLVNQK